MKKIFCSVFCLLLFINICPIAHAEVMRKIDLEEVDGLGLSLTKDTVIKKTGSSSIKITTQWPTTICLAVLDDVDVENARLLYRADVKSEVDGVVMLEMWVEFEGLNYFSRGVESTIDGESDWATIETPFVLETGQNPDKAYLNIIIGGIGTVWIDNIVLSKEPLE